jgi:hypothetical protein
MNKELKPGMWCQTSPEERSAILALALALEIGGFEDRPLSMCPNVGVVSVGKTSVEATAWTEEGEAGYPRVSIPDFIAAMYAEAERRKEVAKPPKLFTYDGDKWVDPLAALTRRVEELERNNLSTHNLNNYAYLMDVGGKLGWVIDQGFAMAIQEATPKGAPALKADKPLVDPTIIETQAKRTLRLSDRRVGDDYALLFDPHASPSGVPFEVALLYLKQGRNAMRLGQYYRIEPRGIGAVGGLRKVAGASNDLGPFDPTCADLCASDWCVLPKEQKA